MRSIILLRHAKSSWDNPSLPDIERPLNKRGLRDAPEMGRRLKSRGISPAAILSSSAARAITTARLVAAEIGFPSESIRETPDLYLASASAIVALLDREAAKYSDVLLVGHNPGISELADRISDSSIDNLPTCGAFAATFTCSDWADILRHPGAMDWHDYPKKVAPPR